MVLFQSSPTGNYPESERGVLIRATWESVQPTATGGYDWGAVDAAIAALPPGFRFNLGIIGGPHIPQWIKDAAALPLISATVPQGDIVVMHYADPAWRAYIDALMDAVALRYGADKRFDTLYIPYSCSVNGMEGNCPPAVLPADYTDAAFADQVFRVAQGAAASLARRGNFHTRVALELHNVNNAATAPGLLLEKMRANPVRYNCAAWWFGQGDYQPELQALMAAAGVPCAAQNIGAYSTDPTRFTDYAGVTPPDSAAWAAWLTTMGTALHVRILELWFADAALSPLLFDPNPAPDTRPVRGYVF